MVAHAAPPTQARTPSLTVAVSSPGMGASMGTPEAGHSGAAVADGAVLAAAGIGAAQAAAARAFLEGPDAAACRLVVVVTGSHASGFASSGAGLRLEAVHLDPLAHLLGLDPTPTVASWSGSMGDVEIDFSSDELRPVLLGVLDGDGGYVERILGTLVLEGSAELDGLVEITRRALSRRLHRHYRAQATTQLRELSAIRTIRKLLSVLRTALTGAHALETGVIVTDLPRLAVEHGFPDVPQLAAATREGLTLTQPAAVRESWMLEAERAFALLDRAHGRSPLPVDPPNAAEVDAWLVGVRRRLA